MSDAGMSYTPSAYRAFLESLLEEGYAFSGFEELPERVVVVRHDVDLSPRRALAMAREEADLGVRTTYCFMLSTPSYNLLEHVETLSEIRSLGHDVALHFDTHHYWEGRPGTRTLEAAVRRECETLGRLLGTTVETVSFHMPPKWVLETAFEGFENTYQPRFFGDIEYVSDSRQKWRASEPFPDERPDQLQMLVHPGLWTSENRSMKDIVSGQAERGHDRVDRYVDAF